MKKSMLGAACAGLSLSLSAATVAYWPFGSYGAADAGGKGNHLRINGGVTFADGAACFDGVMAKCRTERPLDLSVCTKGLTVECWVRVPADSQAACQMLVEHTRQASAAQAAGAFYLDLDETADAKARAMMKTRAGHHIDDGAKSLRDGAWHHLAIVWDPAAKGDAAGRFYVDGVRQPQNAAHRSAELPKPLRDHLYLGSRADAVFRFRGQLDDVRISDAALAPADFLKTRTTENGPVREELLAKGALPPERQELIPLPFGSITARGWIRDMLARGRDGMGGHFGELDADQFDKPYRTRDYDAKLYPGRNQEWPGWCAEMAGEFRLGQIELAETLEDDGLRKKARAFIDAALALQEPDGYLGSYRKTDDRRQDYNAWGCHFFYRALLLEYSRTGDRRILDALHRGLLWFTRNWAGSQKTDYVGPTIIWPMVEVYRLTGDPRLLTFCEDYADYLNARNDWNPYRGGHCINRTGGFERLSREPRAYHVVAYAVRAQLAGILSLANGDEKYKRASFESFDDHVRTVGWQATYVPTSHKEHTGPAGCVKETEYCNFLNWMEYMQWLARLSGDARFGDAIERMAFNAAMGARKKDERAIAYNSSPNQFRATKTSASGGCMEYYEAYTPCLFAACCPAQSIRLMPAYLLKAVMKDRAGDLVVNTYGPCHVATPEVALDVKTQYPFEDTVKIRVDAPKGWTGALHLRLPEWSKGWTVARNGQAVDVKSERRWLKVAGPWAKDELVVTFRNEPVVRAQNEPGLREPLRVVEYGPLVFAQPLKTTWTPCKWEHPTRPLPDGWPWFEATCAEKPVLYALPVETAFDAAKIRVKRVAGGYPWEDPPLRLVVPMVRATAAYAADPERQRHNPAPVRNPVPRDAGTGPEDVELVPMGATNLRLTCFPLGVK